MAAVLRTIAGAAPPFRDRLREAADVGTWARTRFIRLLDGGDAGDAAIRAFMLQFAAATELFPRKLAAICSITPHPEVRAHLVANLIEEEGLRPDGAGGYRSDPTLRHGTWARAMARAAGVRDEEIDDAASRVRSCWFDDRVAEGRWTAALAYLTVGVEGGGPASSALMLPGLRRRGFTDDDLGMLTRHIVMDECHSDVGLELLCRFARTPAEQEDAVAGAARGAREYRLLFEARLHPGS